MEGKTEDKQSACFFHGPVVCRSGNGPPLSQPRIEDNDEDYNESYHEYPSEDANYDAPEEGYHCDSNYTIDVLSRERHAASVGGAVLNTKHHRVGATMWFVTLAKFRHTPTKSDTAKMTAYFAGAAKQGIKMHMALWTLGRYDAIVISEAPDEKAAMSFALNAPGDFVSTETLVAVSREDAIKMVK